MKFLTQLPRLGQGKASSLESPIPQSGHGTPLGEDGLCSPFPSKAKQAWRAALGCGENRGKCPTLSTALWRAEL